MSNRGGELRFRLAGAVGAGFVHALCSTLRVEVEGEEHYLPFRANGQPVLIVCWHGQLLPLMHRHRGEGLTVLVSEHADGEYISRVLERLGFRTARGSSTRGGAKGLRAMLRAARAGHDLAVTPDGPRGPARRVKPGALLAASMLGLPMIPVAAAASAGWHARSWDRFLVPRPFARLRVCYGPPHHIQRGADDEEFAREAARLERALDQLGEKAARRPRGKESVGS